MGFLATSAFARLQPDSEAPLALDQQTECRFNADGSTECLQTYRYTILSEIGREALSRIDIDYPETDTVKIERANLIQPGQKPVALTKSQIDTRMAPNPDQGFLRDKQTSLAFPNLRVGSTIEYAVRHRFAAVPAATQFHYSLDFAPSPVRYDRIHLEFSADRPIKYRSEMMDGFSVGTSADAKKLTIDLKKPHFVNYIEEPDNGFIRRYPRIELGSSLDLQENIGPFAKRYNDILAAPLPARAATIVRKAGNLAPRERVTALMQFLNQNFRYLNDWRASERGLIPFSLVEIDRHGYGDCKDLSALLTSMLRASGIKAEPAWVTRGAAAPTLLAPNIYAVNHAIVRAEVDGAVWWLDPTNPVFAPGATLSDIQERWALVMGADGRVRQDSIPLAAPRVAVDVRMTTRMTGGERGKVDATLMLGGDLLTQLSLSDRNNGKSGGDKALCDLVANEAGQCDIQRGATGFIIPERYEVKANAVDTRALDADGGKYVFSRPSLNDIWDALARYKQNNQLSDVYFGAPETTTADMTIIAKRTDGKPRDCAVSNRWFDISVSGKPTPDGYRYTYRQTHKLAWVTHDDIVSAEFQKFAAQSRECVNGLRFVVQPEKS